MEKFNILEIVKILVDKYGIYPTLEKEFEGGFYFNLNTGAKSHLYLFEDGTVKGRYDYVNKVFTENNTIEEILINLANEFEECLHYRNYYNEAWADLYEDVIGGFEGVKKQLVW